MFRFKQFSVRNERVGLKVGTDGVLLGAVTALSGAEQRILDIGTGTGLVALMLAQRSAMDPGSGECSAAGPGISGPAITGIDIDAGAAQEADLNFADSPWSNRLRAVHRSLQDYADDLYRADGEPAERYDLIVSNPPFFENSLKAPDEQRSNARHTDTLSYRDIITFAGDFLTSDGRISLILPKSEEMRLQRFAASFGFFPLRIVNIRTAEGKTPKRIIAEYSRVKGRVTTEELLLQSDEYKEITKDFYL